MMDTSGRYWVYVLFSQTGGRFYIGVSEDVERRLESHNEGRSRWTSRHRPWQCVYRRPFAGLAAAREHERELKRQKGGMGFFRMTGLDARDFGRKQGS